MNRLIIDGFGLLYRSYYAYKNLTTSTGLGSGGLYGFLTGLRTIKSKYPDYIVHIAWDLASTRKKQIFAEYKANREGSSKPDLMGSIYDLKSIFNCLDVHQSEMLGEEGDDVIASLVDTYKDEDGVIIIYTADKDMLQLVKDGKVVVVRPKSGKFPEKVFDEEKVLTDYGVHPRDIACLLTFIGDTSDNIPGLGRVPSKVVAKLCSKYHTVEEIYAALPSEDLTDFQRKAFDDFRSQSIVNNDLILLRKDLNYETVSGEPDSVKVAEILKKYEIKSISADSLIESFRLKPSNIKKAPAFESFSLFEGVS